jgi:hypothetical protein
MRSLRALCILLALAVQPQPAGAQTRLPATIKEEYASQVKVSGSVLVGLAIGSLDRHAADPRELRIPLDGFSETTPMCLTANTRDGQYWSEATFTVPAKATGLGELEPQPQWRFIEKLARYDRRKFAALARYGANCDTGPGVAYLPVVYDGSRILTAAINSQRAIVSAAQLVLANKPAITGRCIEVDPDVHATAFDLVCEFDLGAAEPGLASLRLRRHQRTGVRTDEFAIRLP